MMKETQTQAIEYEYGTCELFDLVFKHFILFWKKSVLILLNRQLLRKINRKIDNLLVIWVALKGNIFVQFPYNKSHYMF